MAYGVQSYKHDYANGDLFLSETYNEDIGNVEAALNEIRSTTTSSSGARSVGVEVITGVNGGVAGSLYDMLTSLKTLVDGAVAGTIADNSVLAAKLSFAATDKILGRSTAGAGAGEEIPCTALGRSVLASATQSAAKLALGITDGVSGLTADKALVSNGTGGVAVSTVTASELACLANILGNVQTQLNAKLGGGGLAASKLLVSDGSGNVTTAAPTATEAGYLAGVGSAIQTQIDNKLGSGAQAVDAHKVDGHHVFVQSSQPTALATNDIWIVTT